MTKFTIKPGLVLEGSKEDIDEFIEEFGYSTEVYFSSSKDEYLDVKEMHPEHLRNAYLKQLETIIEELRKMPVEEFKEIAFYNLTYWELTNPINIVSQKQMVKLYDAFNTFCEMMAE